MGIFAELIDLAKEKARAALRSAKLPAEMPRSPREVLALLQAAARAITAQSPPPPVSGTAADPDGAATPTGTEAPASPSAQDGPPPVEVPERPEPTRDVSTQTQAELAKFNLAPQSPRPPTDLDARLAALPEEYGESRLVLLPRDPVWLYAYWELTPQQREAAMARGATRMGLRLQPVGEEGEPAGRAHDHACPDTCRNYFLAANPDRRYVLELGYWTAENRWLSVLRSKAVRTPPASRSTKEREVFLDLPFNRATGPRFTRGVVPALDPALARRVRDASTTVREPASSTADPQRAEPGRQHDSSSSSPGWPFSDRPSSPR